MAFSIGRLSVLVVAALIAAAPARAQSGTITGTVRDAATRAPVSTNIVLCVEDGAWCRAGWATDGAGVYRAGVSPGTYYVYTLGTGPGRAYVDEIFPDILCPGDCWFSTALQSGAPLVVTAGGTVRADFDLDRGGTIAGTVTDAATSAPITGIAVIAYVSIGGEPRGAASGTTDATGRYVIEGLPAGRYYAHTQDPSNTYVNEIFDNLACGWSCTWPDLLTGAPIPVALGTSADGRNFALDRGGRITGTVTDAITALPLSPVCIAAFVALSWGYPDVAQDCTDASGAYALEGLPAGSYYLRAVPFGLGHVQELYDGIPCPGAGCDPGSGTPVEVALGTTTGSRDFSLKAGGAIRGTVRDAVTGRASIGGDVIVYTRVGTLARTSGHAMVDYGTGEYVVNGLPAGTYYAHTSLSGYRDEIYDDVSCQAQRCSDYELLTKGTPLTVTRGGVSAGIDFAVVNDLAPGAPQYLAAGVSGSTVTLTWGPPELGGAPSGYLLEAGASPGATFVEQPTAELRYVVAGVPPGRYFVRVRAFNGNGAGPASEDLLVTIPGAGSAPATAPVSLAGWMSGPRLTLTWGAAQSAAGLSGYVVQAGSATGLTDIACVGVNARALTFVPVATGYYFLRVLAMNSHGVGPASNEVLINAGDVPSPPEPPRNLLARVNGATVVLEWSAPSGGPPEGYIIRAGSAPGRSDLAEAAAGPADTMRTFSGVPVGVYYVRVHAVGALGLGPPSNEAVVVVR